VHGSQGRVAVVQGASRGIGLALAAALLRTTSVSRVVATARDPEAPALLALERDHGDVLLRVPVDVTDEPSIERAAARVAEYESRIHLLINCAGLLHAPDGLQPEKALEQIDPDGLRRAFEVNAFGPLLVAKHFFPLLRHDERSVVASLSARVGSIGDDRAGGWYGYRASKAAQNMFTKNLSIELSRRAPHCICVALHPGTVETELSRPFRSRVPAKKLFSTERAAAQLLGVIDKLESDDNGRFLAWDGSEIPW